ncbi:MAG: aldo/keto reductase [Nostoc sp.]
MKSSIKAEDKKINSDTNPDRGAQIALAWLLAQKPWIVPIPGTRNLDHLNENLGAIDVQMTSEDLREIETAFSKITVHGGRMNEMQMQVVDQTV